MRERKTNRKFWTECELELLQYLYEDEGLSATEISYIIERSVSGITIKISDLKLEHSKEQSSGCKSRSTKGNKNPMFGKETWITGKTKETEYSLFLGGQKISARRKEQFASGVLDVTDNKNPMFGKDPWCKGLTKDTNEILLRASERNSIQAIERWNNKTEEEKEIQRRQWALAGCLCGKKDTKIELVIENLLNTLELPFIKQYHIGRYRVDFYCKDKVIECQGDYWHANPLKYSHEDLNETQKKGIKRDLEKVKYLEQENIPYLFLWESEIYDNIENVTQKIKEFVQ